MGITPKNDIVLGVSLAADPLKYQQAVSRLKEISGGDSFSSLLADQDPLAGAGKKTASSGPEDALDKGPPVPIAPRARVAQQKSQVADIYGKLEAFIMQTFIQSMLPKDASSVYGKGTAGEVWKSMLAEKMGNEVARSGQLGIAKRLAAANVTTGSIARDVPAAPLVPVNATLSSLSGKPMPPTANFARALTALQETAAEKAAVKTLGEWVTTVKVERS